MKVIGRKPIDKKKINRILVRATNWVGDMVMTLPALQAIRDNFPKSTVVVLAKSWVIPLIDNHPAVDGVLPLRKGKGYLSGGLEIIKMAGMIRSMKFDIAILFQNAFEAALLAYLGGVGIRIGYNTDHRTALLSHSVVRSKQILEVHQVEYYLSLLRAVGWDAKTGYPCLHIADRDRLAMDTLLTSNGIAREDFLLGLSPGAMYGPAKRWPPERFAVIGDWASENWGAKIVVLGSRREYGICRSVIESMGYPALNMCGTTTLGEAMALIGRSNFIVSNDSGLMHVASALGRPMVALFGSTDPLATGPLSRRAKIVKLNDVDCAPCFKPVCPLDYRCLLGIEPERVWEEMENIRREAHE